ncbi:MAG TPA: LuxR C-terminal-related transcriptional regulator [Anaerolineales bacterium]|nr:LuxR C-terminal-related transcriptional regulator [Anaerolineales bacterium]
MHDHLLETKFHTPIWRSEGILRSRLLDQLQMGLSEQRKLTLVAAPAGYGKTTLITSWLNSLPEQTQHIWLSLEKSDSDPARFLSYLITAWSRVSDFEIDNFLELLSEPQLPPFQNILDEVINVLARREEPAILVLDDYHIITNPLIHEILEYFLEHQPHQAHLVITTRSDPPFPLARLRARGQMTEIRASDLRFTEEEARHFFNQSMQLMLKEEDVQSLEMRTEGWAVGLQLAALALKNLPDQQKFVETFRGSHRYVLDYLAEEIIRQQRDELRKFLIQTSILERFNAEACEALTGFPNSRELLSELEQANLFLIPLDDERVWYRYHHLFADFLRTELPKTETEELYRTAALWHEQNDLFSEAVGYAVASGDLELLADVIDRGLKQDTVWSGGNLTLYAGWLDALPPQAFQSRPELSLNASHILYLLGRFDLAEKQIDQAEQTLQSLPSSPEKEQILALASFYRGAIASVRGDSQQAIEKITFAQERLPQENRLQHARGFFSLGLAYELSGQTERALQNYFRSSEEALSAGVLSLAIHALGSAAQVQVFLGKLHLAEQTCQQALQVAGGKRLLPLGLVEIILGNIALERNELASAEEFLQNGIALSRQGGLMDDLILGLAHLSRIYVYQGRISDAFDAAQEFNTIIQGFNVGRMSMIAAAYTASLQILTGQVGAATLWAAEYQAVRSDQPYDLADLTLVRFLLKMGEHKNIPSILEDVLKLGQAEGQVQLRIESMILMALFRRAEKDIPAAVDWLSQALELAAPEGFIRIFLDEGEALLDLLPKARHAAPEFVDTILGIQQSESNSPPSPLDQLIDPLSEQELRILKLLVAGKSNKEIADELVISVGTAKWHVHNILQKLGVGNRSQAVARARELGL